MSLYTAAETTTPTPATTEATTQPETSEVHTLVITLYTDVNSEAIKWQGTLGNSSSTSLHLPPPLPQFGIMYYGTQK